MSQARTAADRVYRAVRRDIVSGVYAPGARLSRSALAKTLDVSQTPVRDGLQRLANEGLVEVFPQSGTVVTRIDPKGLFETQFLRIALETEVVRRLAGLWDKSSPELQLARSASAEGTACLAPDLSEADRAASFAAVERAFHRALFTGVGMAGLDDLVVRHSGALERCLARDPMTVVEIGLALEFHKSILERIEAGDASGAASAMKAHLSDDLARLPKWKAAFPDFFVGG